MKAFLFFAPKVFKVFIVSFVAMIGLVAPFCAIVWFFENTHLGFISLMAYLSLIISLFIVFVE